MPTVILKKTFASKPGFTISYEKSFSFHGAAVDDLLMQAVNQQLHTLHYVTAANKPVFQIDKNHHYYAAMNHGCQKHNEEDIVVAIIDVMEILGWTFRFQYDAGVKSDQMIIGGSTETSKELFIFQKPPGSSAETTTMTNHSIVDSVVVNTTHSSFANAGAATKPQPRISNAAAAKKVQRCLGVGGYVALYILDKALDD